MRILVLVGDERRRFVDFDAELLAQLANERVARLLARLDACRPEIPSRPPCACRPDAAR